jgi:CheY-like chemotaxis protein
MQHINVTVQRLDSRLHLIRGKPDQIGVQGVTSHLLLDSAELELEVWLVGQFTPDEKHQITEGVMSSLDALSALQSATNAPAPQQPVSPVTQAVPVPQAPAHKRVLIVDDEPFTLEVFQTFLELSGYEVVTTTNSEAAIYLAEQEHPDCILLDVMMPGMDGFTLCKLMRSRPTFGKVPIIFCTAYPALDVQDRSRAAGGDMVVLKPFEMNTLVSAIESVRQHPETLPSVSTPAAMAQQQPAARPKPKQTTMLGTMTVSVDSNAPTDTYINAFQHLITGQ